MVLILPEDSANIRIYGELGLIYAKKNDKEKADEMIAKLETLKGAFDYGETSYLQGRIKANSGQHTEAIKYLEKSLDEGQLFFNSVTFQGDPDLMVLKNDKNYQALLERNKQL